MTRISFIGYSLGGLIVRAALLLLGDHKSKFYSLVTIGTPHLGYLYKKGALFNTGMMLFNKLGEQRVLSQLRYADGNSIKDAYLYTLAENGDLGHFKNILLVSSSQDQWVPYDSARLQVPEEIKEDDY